MEQTGRRPVVIWQSDALTSVLASVHVVPLTTNLDRAQLAGTALLQATEGACPMTPCLSLFKCAPYRSPRW